MKRGLIGTLIFGLLFAPIGYFVAFHFGKPILDNAKASTKWPSVEGVVERSEVDTSRNSDKTTMYSAEVLYRYTVAGQEFRANTVSFGGNVSSSSSSDAYAVTNRYPVGQKVQVYYEPEVPANAVLEPGVTWKSYLVFGIGLVFLTAKPRVVQLFLDDVAAFLDTEQIRYSPSVQFTGKTGFVHKYDFVIPKSQSASERIVKAINTPTREKASSLIFSWTDTRDSRPADSNAYAILNDAETEVSSDIISALASYDIKTILWSTRDHFLPELAA